MKARNIFCRLLLISNSRIHGSLPLGRAPYAIYIHLSDSTSIIILKMKRSRELRLFDERDKEKWLPITFRSSDEWLQFIETQR
jgi:hypothetical protein